MSAGTRKRFDAFSSTPLSMEMPGDFGKRSRTASCHGRPDCAAVRIAAITSASAGSAFVMASRIALAFQTNMPEFQYQPPSARNAGAVAASGFSLKRSTCGSPLPLARARM